MTVEIHGFCDARFKPLQDAFRANFEDGLELGASLALMQHGRPLVDLWAGWADGARTRPWDRDTIVVVFSTTKVALCLSFLMLVDRGLVDLDATVATYWPEFAQGGKGQVTVREAMSHRAGVPGFEPPVAFETIHDWAACTANIAAQTHWFGGESVVCYHASTLGFILGEIIRRVDGRMPSRFFREEIAEKAGIDFQIGLGSEDERRRVAQLAILDPLPASPFANPLAVRVSASVGEGDRNSWERQRADVPGSNGYCNGRSIARLCAIAANGGELDGVRYLSKAIIDEASREQARGDDPIFGPLKMGLVFGLHGEFFPAPSATSFHWGGTGGSLACMDLKTGVSFGYAMNNLIMTAGSAPEPRFQRLWEALGDVMAAL